MTETEQKPKEKIEETKTEKKVKPEKQPLNLLEKDSSKQKVEQKNAFGKTKPLNKKLNSAFKKAKPKDFLR